MIFNPASKNPLFENPLQSRVDMQAGLINLFNPLVPYFSQGRARVRLDAVAAHFDRSAADLEGFARPLWGLAALAAGGGEFAHWDFFVEGISNGVNPNHPEYWGAPDDNDQRLVEIAALGFALALIPERIWDPLDPQARSNLASYLVHARGREYNNNNWKFFRVLVDIALDRLGIKFDRTLTDTFLQDLDGFYLGDGWYRDGNARRVDHYVPFAMQFYGLVYSKLVNDNRSEQYRERARLFAKDFRHWFASDGATVPFGRSLTYRFACAGFWSALAFADVEALPWGEIKGLCLRHLRWWSNKPIANNDGTLSIGFGYPNLLMSESYNSSGSPYWALKAFLPLAIDHKHPFWTAEEMPFAPSSEAIALRHPGMVIMHNKDDVIALSCGQEHRQRRFGPEKYAKFAYSARYGFSIESDERAFTSGAFDSMLAFSDDGRHYRVREGNEDAKLADNRLYARWSPWEDVTVETWLVPAGLWHVRVHRIQTPRRLQSIEGGFAIARQEQAADLLFAQIGCSYVIGAEDFCGIIDLGSSVKREGVAQKTLPNTNLICARAMVPQLRGDIPMGETILLCAVLGVKDPLAYKNEWLLPPAAPDLSTLRALFQDRGMTVSAMEAKGYVS